jgi:hypothetical protein
MSKLFLHEDLPVLHGSVYDRKSGLAMSRPGMQLNHIYNATRVYNLFSPSIAPRNAQLRCSVIVVQEH